MTIALFRANLRARSLTRRHHGVEKNRGYPPIWPRLGLQMVDFLCPASPSSPLEPVEPLEPPWRGPPSPSPSS
jgi:hypothetical protein